MNLGRVILWDFDGTLGERPGGWSGLLAETLDAELAGSGLGADDFRPHLEAGFPWHDWRTARPGWDSAEAWWDNVRPVLALAYVGAGLDPALAADLARTARRRYPDPARFVLYEDTLPALRRLAAHGWRHAVMSNHVPELAAIVAATPLAGLVDHVISSGVSGYEKPHPESYAHAQAVIGAPVAWMVGDNPECDVDGARRAGLRAVLVRRDDGRTRPFARDLAAAADIILSEEGHRFPSALGVSKHVPGVFGAADCGTLDAESDDGEQ
jgi:putative hydrolase of the HAD superfamily